MPVPEWKMTSEGCINCQVYQPPPANETVLSVPMYESRRCWPNKYNTCENDLSCRITLQDELSSGRAYITTGRVTITLEECAYLVNASEECGKRFAYGPQCECQRQDECCGEDCSVSWSTGIWEIHEINSVMVSPNPTCDGGILSADGTLCCANTCVQSNGDNICGVESSCWASVATTGACCKEDLNELRTCDKYNFPCFM